MDIAKSRAVIVAVLAALTLSSVAFSAEAPMRGVPRAVERQPAVQGLNNPALKLSDSQRARIQKIVESYRAEESAKVQRYSTQGVKPDAETASASRQASERMMAAVDQVLDASQRKTLKAEQAEQAAKLAQAMQAAHPMPPARLPGPTGTEQPRSR